MASPRRPAIWSPQAQQDLIDIWFYLAREMSADTADRVLRDIGGASERLEAWPPSGRRREDLLPGLRSVAVRPNAVFYRLADDRIEIVRVLDGRRDIDAIFSEPRD
jgi:toxin ParE1/3/4